MTERRKGSDGRWPGGLWFWIAAALAATTAIVVQARYELDLAGGLTVLLTAALVWATWRYTKATEEMAETQQRQMSAFIAANERDVQLRTRDKVLEVWNFGIEHVVDSALLATRFTVWFDHAPESFTYLAANASEVGADANRMRDTARTYYAMALGLPEHLRDAIVAHRSALERFSAAVTTTLSAISKAADSRKDPTGPLTIDAVEAALRGRTDPEKSLGQFLAVRDGSLARQCSETYREMMHEVMALVDGEHPHSHEDS